MKRHAAMFGYFIFLLLILIPFSLQSAQKPAVRGLADSGEYPKTIRLATLEWPPYTGSGLPELGATSLVVKKAFEQAGYTVQIDVIPWNDAISRAGSGEYDGYFPEYYSRGIEQNFIFSKHIGDSPLGFAERKQNAINWKRIDDLKPFTVGVVDGYVNTEMLDQWIAEEKLEAIKARDDVSNIFNLISGKTDLAAIDPYVFQYHLMNMEQLQNDKDLIRFNDTLLDLKACWI